MLQKVKRLILHLVEIILLLTFIAGALGQLGNLWWIFEILSHFYHFYFAVFSITLVAFILLKKKTAIILSLAGLIISGLVIFSVYFSSFTVNNNSDFVRIMSYNTNFYLNNSEQIADNIKQTQPDVVVLLETNKNMFTNLQTQLKATYSYSYFHDQQQPSNMAFLSKLELLEPELFMPDNSLAGFIRTEFKYKDQLVTLLATHPYPPYNSKLAQDRRNYYKLIAQKARQEKNPTIIIGDFNTTPWSPLFRKLIKDSGLRDSRLGFGIMPTWPTFVPAFMRIPIDHALVSSDITVNNRFIGDSKASDHLPIILDISIN